MAKQSELEKSANAEISRLERNIKRLEKQIWKQKAEIKALENMKEWSKNVRRKPSTNKQ
jgi:predicted ribosome quality control (RQC) complex YloA/Tae2 family protein